MLTVFFRTLILYAVSVIAIRLMGKRQIGQLQPYEFVLALLIADLAAAPMENVGTPLLYGVVPILTMLFLYAVCTLLSVKWMAVRRALSGGPSVIIRDGTLQYGEMKKLCYTVTDLTEELRERGFLNIADVRTAILETSGQLSVFPRAAQRAVTPGDLKLQTAEEDIPLTLAVDGRPQREHLRMRGLDEKWLDDAIRPLGICSVSEVLLASLDSRGMLFIQSKKENSGAHLIQVFPQKENEACGR